jgi:solute carrier family 30 (zinc transporter), member 2
MDLSTLFTSCTAGLTCCKPLTDEISTWSKEKRLSVAIGLSATFMLLEFVGGIYANSLAILTDAAHLLTDVASFAIALCAVIISKWKSTSKFSFGFKRAEILGALFR